MQDACRKQRCFFVFFVFFFSRTGSLCERQPTRSMTRSSTQFDGRVLVLWPITRHTVGLPFWHRFCLAAGSSLSAEAVRRRAPAGSASG
jgi:hypothetical protein